MNRAGRFRRRLTIESRVETENDFGEVEWTWTTHATVWAGIEPLRGREFFAAEQLQSEVQGRIRMRYRGDLTTKMRGYEAATETYFDFTEIIHDPRRTETQIMYIVRDADGWRE